MDETDGPNAVPELPWPESGDRLFRDDLPDWNMNACLQFHPDAWFGYIEGYKMAGDILVERAQATRSDQDFLVYPIVFNYRHYIELALKLLIRKTKSLLDHSVDFSNEHDLRKLWRECRPLIVEAWPDEPTEPLDAAEELVQQLGDVDQKSFAFRYPIDRGGKSYLPEGLLRINLRHLAEGIAKLSNFLDSVTEGTLVHLEWKGEMEDYYGP